MDERLKMTKIPDNTRSCKYSGSFRNKAIGMAHGGMSSKRVCQQLNIFRSQLLVWLRRVKLGQGLGNQPGQSRKSTIHPVAKTLAGMAAGKRYQSTRKLSQRLTRYGYNISRSNVHCYLRKHGNETVQTQQNTEIDREAARTSPEVLQGSQGLVSRGLEEGALV